MIDNQDQEHIDPLENNLECSTEFAYPAENLPEDLWALVQQHVTSSMATAMTDMLTKIANAVLPADNPRLVLAALFYASDVDLSYVLQCQNSESAIARRLGCGKQTLNSVLKQVRSDFGLTHSHGMNHGVTSNTYEANARKIKPS